MSPNSEIFAAECDWLERSWVMVRADGATRRELGGPGRRCDEGSGVGRRLRPYNSFLCPQSGPENRQKQAEVQPTFFKPQTTISQFSRCNKKTQIYVCNIILTPARDQLRPSR